MNESTFVLGAIIALTALFVIPSTHFAKASSCSTSVFSNTNGFPASDSSKVSSSSSCSTAGFTGNGETFVTGGSGKASCSSVAGHSGGSGINVHNSNTGAVSCSFARGPSQP